MDSDSYTPPIRLSEGQIEILLPPSRVLKVKISEAAGAKMWDLDGAIELAVKSPGSRRGVLFSSARSPISLDYQNRRNLFPTGELWAESVSESTSRNEKAFQVACKEVIKAISDYKQQEVLQ